MPRRTASRAAMLLGVAALACAEARESEAPPDRGATTRVVVEIRIGAAEGDAAYMFGWLEDVAATRSGKIFTVDSRLDEIRRYDAQGAFLGNVGRRGQGPGEYENIYGIEATPDDRLAVQVSGRRVIVYGEDGAYLQDLSFPEATRGLEASSDGSLVVAAFDRSRLDLTGDWRGRRGWDSHLVRLSQDGEILQRIPLPDPEPSHQGWVVPRAEGTLEPFIVKTMYAWSPLGYLLTGRNDEYSIRVEVAGSPPIRLERQLPRIRLGGPEREPWLAMLRKVQRIYDTEVPLDARASMERAEEEHLPDFKPYFRNILVDDDGRIWVHRYVEAELWDPPPEPPQSSMTPLPWREPPTFDVFAPDGRFLGTVVLPRLTRFTQARGDTLWGVQEDFDTGHQYVVRLRLEPPL